MRHAWIALVAVFALLHGAAIAQVTQPMRVPAGSYTIGGGGGNIPTECYWHRGEAPDPTTRFVHYDESLSVTRFEGGKANGTRSLADAISPKVGEPWLTPPVPQSISFTTFTPAAPMPNVHYKLTSDGKGLMWDISVERAIREDDDVVRALRREVQPATLELDRVYYPLLRDADPTNPILGSIRELRQYGEWVRHAKADGHFEEEAELLQVLRARKARFDALWKGLSPEESLAIIESCYGRSLSAEERAALSVATRVSLPESPPWKSGTEVHPGLAARCKELGIDCHGIWLLSDSPEVLKSLIGSNGTISGAPILGQRSLLYVPVFVTAAGDAWTLTETRGRERIGDREAFIRRLHELSASGYTLVNCGAGKWPDSVLQVSWEEWYRSARAGAFMLSPDGTGLVGPAAQRKFSRSAPRSELATEVRRLRGAGRGSGMEEAVGQGDMILSKHPDGTYVMLDLGRGRRGVQEFLESLAGKKATVRLIVLLSHQDADHANVAAFKELIEYQRKSTGAFVIEQIIGSWLDGVKADALRAELGKEYTVPANALGWRRMGVTLWARPQAALGPRLVNGGRPDDPFHVFAVEYPGGVKYEMLRLKSPKTANASSFIVRITHNGVRRLYTGDLDKQVVVALLAWEEAKQYVSAEEVKHPHHIEYSDDGQWQDRTREFYRLVNPAMVVLSNVGAKQKLENTGKLKVLIRSVLPGVVVTDTHARSQNLRSDVQPRGSESLARSE